MIGEILEKIVEAEERAAKILQDAKDKAAKIETDAQIAIDKINTETRNEVAKAAFIKDAGIAILRPKDIEQIKIEIPKDKLDKAEKFIISEFGRRFAK